MTSIAESYPAPTHGWTCFHCGENFTDYGAASDHFGNPPGSVEACLMELGGDGGLVKALRKLERYVIELHGELPAALSSDIDEALAEWVMADVQAEMSVSGRSTRTRRSIAMKLGPSS